jgi:hypothetical protein
MSKACTGLGEFIEVGCLVGSAPVGPDALIAHVIRHNQDEICLFLCTEQGERKKEKR